MNTEFYESYQDDYDSDNYRDDNESEDDYDDEDYDEFEYEDSEHEKIREEDHKYLAEFEESMIKAGLSKKTIRKHMSNVEFYLYQYLLDYCDDRTMQSGLHQVDSFLGDWFIRKAMWSSVNAIKENITSFKKFYKCMMENGNITKEQYQEFLEMIKEDKDIWLDKMREYDEHLYEEFDEDWYLDWLLR